MAAAAAPPLHGTTAPPHHHHTTPPSDHQHHHHTTTVPHAPAEVDDVAHARRVDARRRHQLPHARRVRGAHRAVAAVLCVCSYIQRMAVRAMPWVSVAVIRQRACGVGAVLCCVLLAAVRQWRQAVCRPPLFRPKPSVFAGDQRRALTRGGSPCPRGPSRRRAPTAPRASSRAPARTRGCPVVIGGGV